MHQEAVVVAVQATIRPHTLAVAVVVQVVTMMQVAVLVRGVMVPVIQAQTTTQLQPRQ